MRVLVTGREGQLALSLAEVAAATGSPHELIFAGRPDFDLLDSAGMERTIDSVRPDVIVNAAAYTAVDAAEDDAETAMAANGTAPGVIARAAAAIGARLIHVSTDYVFDGTLDRPYREDDPTAPLGVYGETKLAGETAVAAAGGDAAILRTAWVYGPFGGNFVKTMLRLAETREEVSVVADQVGSPTSSLDLASAILRLADKWPEDGADGARVYHAAGTGTTSWADLARAVFAVRAEIVGGAVEVNDIPTAAYPTRAKRPANSVLDSGKLARQLGGALPEWRRSVDLVTRRLLTAPRTR